MLRYQIGMDGLATSVPVVNASNPVDLLALPFCLQEHVGPVELKIASLPARNPRS
jgi:hypothetical protein